MSTRSQAADVIVAVVYGGMSLDRALENLQAPLPKGKERAFVQALVYGVLRHYERLESLLSFLTRKPIRDQRIHVLALIGLFQMGYTRVPVHAAVSETVKAAAPETWAKPLLNALLRNYERKRLELDSRADQTLESRYAHPKWLIDRIAKEWPEHWMDLLTANNQHPPLTLRVNAKRTSTRNYLELLHHQNIEARAGYHSQEAIVLENPIAVDLLPGFDQGEVSVQDEAAQLAAQLLSPKKGMRVLDLCAAPGGKSCHLLETFPDAFELLCIDIDAVRLARIQSNLERLQLKATLKVGDARYPSAWWDGKPFDRILLDAPCSATGVIRRHPDIKLHRKPSDIASLAKTQLEMLDQAWDLLAEGGRLLYVTCSILKEENVEVIRAFLERSQNAREIAILEDVGIKEQHGRQILTGTDGMDGFYYACLEKQHADS